MNIFVLLKQVPDLVEDLEVDGSGRSLDPDSVELKLNEFDDQALEEALLVKEAAGGRVTVMALDGEGVDKILFTALAKGADRALKITGAGEVDGNARLGRIFHAAAGADSPDLVLTGVQAADDRDGQLGPIFAALAGMPCVEVVTAVAPADGSVTVHKEYSGGILAELEVDLPAVLGIQAARQTPRYAPVSKVRQIQQSTTLETRDAPGADGAPVFGVVEMTPPESGGGAQMLGGVEELVELLAQKGVI